MEIFTVAHEYSHHLLEHGSIEASVESSSLIQDEYDADRLAHVISMCVAGKEPQPSLLFQPSVCAAIILAALDVVARAREVLSSGTDKLPNRKDHPPARQRMEFTKSL